MRQTLYVSRQPPLAGWFPVSPSRLPASDTPLYSVFEALFCLKGRRFFSGPLFFCLPLFTCHSFPANAPLFLHGGNHTIERGSGLFNADTLSRRKKLDANIFPNLFPDLVQGADTGTTLKLV
jgi:hypothetical protein